MRKIIVVACSVVGLYGCASGEDLRQSAVDNCLKVGIAQNDPQFPVCARSYALQQQDGALNQNYNIQEDIRESDRRIRRRQDVLR